MAGESVRAPESVSDFEVMASIDEDGGAQYLIIADISGNDGWISIPARSAASLVDWR